MSTATDQPIRSDTDWRAVLAAVLCGVAVAMNVGKVPIAMPQLRAEFGLSLVAAGWVSSMINTLAVTTALLFGLLGDRIGALRMCFIGLSFSALGGVVALFAGDETALLVSRFAEGAGVVCVAVSAPALLSVACNPIDRRFALGIWSAYLPAGVSLIMLLAPLVMPLGGWRGVWVLTLLVIVLAALAVNRSRSAYRLPVRPGLEAHPLAAAKEALCGPPIIAMLVAASGLWRDALIVTGTAALLGIALGLLVRRCERRQRFQALAAGTASGAP